MRERDGRFGHDPGPYLLAAALLVVFELLRRLLAPQLFVPHDFTAYFHAADLFVAGENPYTDARFQAARYDGFPYNYFPGTLYLIAPLAFVPTHVALALDWVGRVVTLALSLGYLRRRILPKVPVQVVLGVALLHEPLLVDLLAGNLTTYLLGAGVAAVYLGDAQPRRPAGARAVALALMAGVVLAFKPFWILPAGFALVAARAWWALGATSAAMVAVLAASLPQARMLPSFLEHTQAMRAFYFSVDLLNLAPALLPVALLVGVAGGLALLRRGPRRWIWLYGCLSMPVWPRLASYSFILTLPVVLFLIRRWGWKRAGLYSLPMLGPLPFLLRRADPWPEQYPAEILELWSHYLWTSVTAIVVFVILWRMGEEEETPPDP